MQQSKHVLGKNLARGMVIRLHSARTQRLAQVLSEPEGEGKARRMQVQLGRMTAVIPVYEDKEYTVVE